VRDPVGRGALGNKVSAMLAILPAHVAAENARPE
jgi:hypothetical protein